MGTGLKKSDDFKTFSHRNINTSVPLGLMFQYNQNYWITTNTSELASVFHSCVVRRCNNFFKFINPKNGAIKSIPCVVEYEMGNPNPTIDKDVITPNNRANIIIQGNEDTLNITQNQRFILNGRPFKLVGYNDVLQNNVVDNNTTLIYWTAVLDEKQPTDDYASGIANRYEYKFNVDITNKIEEQIQGFKGKLNSNVTLNGENIDVKTVWVGNENVTIDENGNYQLIGEIGSIATIQNYIEGNPESYDMVVIRITQAITDSYDIVINPLYKEVAEGDTVTFTAFLYKNGVLQTSNIDCIDSGADKENYVLIKTNNTFVLKNISTDVKLLTLQFTSGATSKTINIKLAPMF